MPFLTRSTTIPSHSNSIRRPSDTISTRSIGFASDRSPLQKLELELKHISKEESGTPSLGRTLSKRQEERLQRSTTITSRLTASPASPSSGKIHVDIRDGRYHQHQHRMAHLLGNHQAKGNGRQGDKEEDGYYDNLSNAEEVGGPWTAHRIPPTSKPPHDHVGRKAHHHGYHLQHINQQSSSGSNSSEGNSAHILQTADRKNLFDAKVAHLTLEDRELDDGSTNCGDAAGDGDGTRNLHREESIDITLDTLFHAEYPFPSPPSPYSSEVLKSSKVPIADDPITGDSPGGCSIEKFTDGHISASEPRSTLSVEPISAFGAPRPPVESMDSTRISRTKEEKKDELILSFITAIKPRAALAPTSFSPPLSIKCGPLLRYTGLRRDGNKSQESTAKEERETWRGSIMIVTTDDHSDYTPLPFIRLFVQSVPGPGTRDAAATEGEFIRSAEEFPGRKHTPSDVHFLSSVQPTRKVKDGEKLGKYKEVEATKLHYERGVTFWRFIIEVELGDQQARVAYRINHGPSIVFWVPARGETMNTMFHSCNGFSLSVNPDDFCGPNPLWRDVLREHQKKPFHVMLGGGDQLYNDAVSKQTKYFREWLAIKNPFHKLNSVFTDEMANELEEFYLERYSMWFSQGLFGVANAQIPMVNIWDDHDIIDGFGSYPHHFNRCPVFTGLGAVAFKYYLLFQHQSTVDEKEENEPSWLLGAARGPYITELSRSCFMFLGRKVAFLGLDCRTERMRDLVLSKKSYYRVFDRLQKEVVRGETKHLIVLLGVPIAYPRLVWLENLMTSRLMDPFKALGRMGYLGGFVNSFDGGVELLDDLDDHWTAKNHKIERNWLIQRLQEFAVEKSVRITILGGDVHLAGIGQFYSNPKLNIPRGSDHRYMPNIISSAIVNTPPPNAMADVLNKRNKVHHLDYQTDEDMYPIFDTDVDGKSRNNKRLLPRRNYAVIREHVEGETSLDEMKPTKRSTFSKIRNSTFRKSSKADSTTNTTVVGLNSVNVSASQTGHLEVRKDALGVTLRMEVDQKDPSGNTKPYRLIIPILNCEKPSEEKSYSDDQGGWI